MHQLQARYSEAQKELSEAKLMLEELGYEEEWMAYCSGQLDIISSAMPASAPSS